jgi:SRSO17 transposase
MRGEQALAAKTDRAEPVPGGPTAGPRICTIPIGLLKRTGKTAPPAGENRDYVVALARSAVKLPPLFVHRRTMRIIEGAHRLQAAELRGDDAVEVIFFDDEPGFVAPGGGPGGPPSFDDRAATATRLLSSHPDWPDRAVATVSGLAPRTVRALRKSPASGDGVLIPFRPHPPVPAAQPPEVPAPRPSIPVHQVAKEFELEPHTVVEVLSRLRRGRQQDRPSGPLAPVPASAVPPDATSLVLDRVCDELFATLSRRDQRLRARQSLEGLLATAGRKTIRNIAACVDGPGIDQRLHHFISDSTWDWEPVCAALTRYVARAMEPEAWVIRPVLVPKAGQQTVAVARRFCPARGKAVYAQQAVGVLAVSEAASVPVSWRLQVPREWAEDPHRRVRAALPDEVDAETLGECAASAYLQVLSRTDRSGRPAVLDGRDMEPAQLMEPLHAAEAPLLVRVPATILLQMTDPGRTGHRAPRALTARQIVEAARFRSRPVAAPDSRTDSSHLLTTVDVRWPAENANADLPMQLIAVSPIGENVCEELWLTTLTTVPATTVLRLSKLVRRVDRDLETVSRHAGVWDFSGRSFPGWHRHVTLASVAHLVRLLARTDYPAELLDPGTPH